MAFRSSRLVVAVCATLLVGTDAVCSKGSECTATEGQWCEAGVCVDTPPGRYPKADAEGTNPCPKNTRTTKPINNLACTACPAGSTSAEGAEKCTALPTTTTITVSETSTETSTETATDTVTSTVSATSTGTTTGNGANPTFWLRINNMEFALMSAVAKDELCQGLRTSTVRRLQVPSNNVYCHLSSGSVYARVRVTQRDDMLVLQNALDVAKDDVAAEAMEQIERSPALLAATTGPVSTEFCGNGEMAECAGVLLGQGLLPVQAVGQEQLPGDGVVVPVVPVASMPNDVEAAKALAIEGVQDGLLNQYERSQVPVWKSSWSLVAASTTILFALIVLAVVIKKVGSSTPAYHPEEEAAFNE